MCYIAKARWFLIIKPDSYVSYYDFIPFYDCKNAQNDEGSEDYISSVSWIKEGNILAVGDSQAEIQLWYVDW